MSRVFASALSLLMCIPVTSAHGQFMDVLPSTIESHVVLILGVSSLSNGAEVVESLGSGATYMVPCETRTNEVVGTPCIVTARHNLWERGTTNFLDGLYVKLNLPSSFTDARYVRVPLQKTPPHNFWISERNRDLAVIPLPAGLVNDYRIITLLEAQVLTPANAKRSGVRAGSTVAAFCVQPEYLDQADIVCPGLLPIVRVGHLARLGHFTSVETNVFTRPHVIDMHASPGNSGASVVVYGNPKPLSSCPMFLGLVIGYREESGSYKSIAVNAGGRASYPLELEFVGSGLMSTNTVRLDVTAIPNPDLTFVAPVDELVGLSRNLDFRRACLLMNQMASRYQVFSRPVPHGSGE